MAIFILPSVFRKFICAGMACVFALTSSGVSYAQPTPGFPAVAAPALLKGISVHPDNAMLLDFIVDPGAHQPADIRPEAERFIKYFMASLAIPEKDLWVNLSPYEKDRIVPPALGQTGMGREMLAQDYLLKQVTASLMDPEGDVGRVFWEKIYAKARAQFGTSDIPVDTFNKVWIMPAKAVVYQRGGRAVITEGRLKVMLDADHVAEGHAGITPVNDTAQAIMREVVLPVLEQEVNDGPQFAPLRQVYHALILAHWYRKNLKQSILNKVYADKSRIEGIDIDDKQAAQKIWEQYAESFKKGAHDLIREEVDPTTGEMIPRRYFFGGVVWDGLDAAMTITTDAAALTAISGRNLLVAHARLDHVTGARDAAELKKPEGEEFRRASLAEDRRMFDAQYADIVDGLKTVLNLKEYAGLIGFQERESFPIEYLKAGQDWLLPFKLDLVRYKKEIADIFGLPTSPVVVLKFAKFEYYLVDGHHRVSVALENNEGAIPAHIIDFQWLLEDRRVAEFRDRYRYNPAFKKIVDQKDPMIFRTNNGNDHFELYKFYGSTLIRVQDAPELTRKVMEDLEATDQLELIQVFLESLGNACASFKGWDHSHIVREAIDMLHWPGSVSISRRSFDALQEVLGMEGSQIKAWDITIEPVDRAQASPAPVTADRAEFPLVPEDIDIDRIPAVKSGLMSEAQAAYYVALKQKVNPESSSLKAVHGASGPNIIDVLLASDATDIVNVDGAYLSIWQLREALRTSKTGSFVSEGVKKAVLEAKQEKRSQYFYRWENVQRALPELIVQELQLMGASHINIEGVDNNVVITFKWAYPGQELKDRTVRFVGATDLTNVPTYPEALKKIISGKEPIDLYFQKSAMNVLKKDSQYLPLFSKAARKAVLIGPFSIVAPQRWRHIDVSSALNSNEQEPFMRQRDVNDAYRPIFLAQDAGLFDDLLYGWHLELWQKYVAADASEKTAVIKTGHGTEITFYLDQATYAFRPKDIASGKIPLERIISQADRNFIISHGRTEEEIRAALAGTDRTKRKSFFFDRQVRRNYLDNFAGLIADKRKKGERAINIYEFGIGDAGIEFQDILRLFQEAFEEHVPEAERASWTLRMVLADSNRSVLERMFRFGRKMGGFLHQMPFSVEARLVQADMLDGERMQEIGAQYGPADYIFNRNTSYGQVVAQFILDMDVLEGKYVSAKERKSTLADILNVSVTTGNILAFCARRGTRYIIEMAGGDRVLWLPGTRILQKNSGVGISPFGSGIHDVDDPKILQRDGLESLIYEVEFQGQWRWRGGASDASEKNGIQERQVAPGVKFYIAEDDGYVFDPKDIGTRLVPLAEVVPETVQRSLTAHGWKPFEILLAARDRNRTQRLSASLESALAEDYFSNLGGIMAQKEAQGERTITIYEFGIGDDGLEFRDIIALFRKAFLAHIAPQDRASWKVRMVLADCNRGVLDRLFRADGRAFRAEGLPFDLSVHLVQADMLDAARMQAVAREHGPADYIFNRNTTYGQVAARSILNAEAFNGKFWFAENRRTILFGILSVYLTTKNILSWVARAGTRYIIESTHAPKVLEIPGARILLKEGWREKGISLYGSGIYDVSDPESLEAEGIEFFISGDRPRSSSDSAQKVRVTMHGGAYRFDPRDISNGKIPLESVLMKDDIRALHKAGWKLSELREALGNRDRTKRISFNLEPDVREHYLDNFAKVAAAHRDSRTIKIAQFGLGEQDKEFQDILRTVADAFREQAPSEDPARWTIKMTLIDCNREILEKVREQIARRKGILGNIPFKLDIHLVQADMLDRSRMQEIGALSGGADYIFNRHTAYSQSVSTYILNEHLLNTLFKNDPDRIKLLFYIVNAYQTTSNIFSFFAAKDTRYIIELAPRHPQVEKPVFYAPGARNYHGPATAYINADAYGIYDIDDPQALAQAGFYGLKRSIYVGYKDPDNKKAREVLKAWDNGVLDAAEIAAAGQDALKGGIDLNADNLDLEVTGDDIEFRLPESWRGVDLENIKGITPVIINITPVTDMRALLGLS